MGAAVPLDAELAVDSQHAPEVVVERCQLPPQFVVFRQRERVGVGRVQQLPFVLQTRRRDLRRLAPDGRLLSREHFDACLGLGKLC